MTDLPNLSHPVYRPLPLQELRSAIQTRPSWLRQGFLAPGSLTMLTSVWKAGKTTLLSVLLERLGKAGQLAGSAVSAGKAVVVSEEDFALWVRRGEGLDFGVHVRWLCRPFRARPTPYEWRALIDSLAELRREEGVDLVAIDPLASFLWPRVASGRGPPIRSFTGCRNRRRCGRTIRPGSRRNGGARRGGLLKSWAAWAELSRSQLRRNVNWGILRPPFCLLLTRANLSVRPASNNLLTADDKKVEFRIEMVRFWGKEGDHVWHD